MEGSSYKPTKGLLDSLQKRPLKITVVNFLGGSGSTAIIHRVSENDFIPNTVPTLGVNPIPVPSHHHVPLSAQKAGMSGSSYSYPVTSVAAHPPATTASTLLALGLLSALLHHPSILQPRQYPHSGPIQGSPLSSRCLGPGRVPTEPRLFRRAQRCHDLYAGCHTSRRGLERGRTDIDPTVIELY